MIDAFSWTNNIGMIVNSLTSLLFQDQKTMLIHEPSTVGARPNQMSIHYIDGLHIQDQSIWPPLLDIVVPASTGQTCFLPFAFIGDEKTLS